MEQALESLEQDTTGMELRDLLTDQEFASRTTRCRDPGSSLDPIRRIALVFAEEQDVILQALVDTAVAFTGADSAGISLLEGAGAENPRFRWVAIAGSFAQYLHGTTPRFFSPCGTCLDRRRPQLYSVTKTYYDYLGVQADPITEGILIPWENDAFRGTIWAVSHAAIPAFDPADYNLLNMLAEFTSLAIHHHDREKHLRSEEKSAASAAMANDLAHQINNPLQGLTNSLFLAQQGGDSAQLYIQQAAGELAQVTALVRSLLSLDHR